MMHDASYPTWMNASSCHRHHRPMMNLDRNCQSNRYCLSNSMNRPMTILTTTMNSMSMHISRVSLMEPKYRIIDLQLEELRR